MKIGIIGYGVVGSAVGEGFKRLSHEVLVHDIKMGTIIESVIESELVFICVPTPQKEDGSCDTSIVEKVVNQLLYVGFNGTIAIKSTVVPGFTEDLINKYSDELPHLRFRLAFVPEFLREKSAFYDFTEGHDLLIVGTWSPTVFNQIVTAHGKYPKSTVHVKPTEAELAKYYSNVFNAMRIIFANGFYEVCKKLNADYSKIKGAMMMRPTMVDYYMDCNEKWRGFAGVCLPKDTAAFAKLVDDLGVPANIFKTIVEDNKLYRPTVPQGMRMDDNQAVS